MRNARAHPEPVRRATNPERICDAGMSTVGCRKEASLVIGTRKGHQQGMTVTVTAAGPVTNPPDTPNRIPPPPDPPGVPTAAADAGTPVAVNGAGLCWPPTACHGMGDWPFFGPDTERAVSRARRVGPGHG